MAQSEMVLNPNCELRRKFSTWYNLVTGINMQMERKRNELQCNGVFCAVGKKIKLDKNKATVKLHSKQV